MCQRRNQNTNYKLWELNEIKTKYFKKFGMLLKGRYILLNTNIRKKEKSQMSALVFTLRTNPKQMKGNNKDQKSVKYEREEQQRKSVKPMLNSEYYN